MIPLWILTILHYVSLAVAVTVLALVAWQFFRRRGSPRAGECEPIPNCRTGDDKTE